MAVVRISATAGVQSRLLTSSGGTTVAPLPQYDLPNLRRWSEAASKAPGTIHITLSKFEYIGDLPPGELGSFMREISWVSPDGAKLVDEGIRERVFTLRKEKVPATSV